MLPDLSYAAINAAQQGETHDLVLENPSEISGYTIEVDCDRVA